MESEARRPGQKLYTLALAAMLLGVIATFVAIPLAVAFPPGRGATFAQALQVLLTIGVLVNPIPAIVRPYLPSLLVIAFFWVQIALIARRVLLCMRNRGLVVPVALSGGWKVLLVIALLSWVLGTAVFLSPIVLHAMGARGAVWAMQIANTFFTGLLLLPAANLFGVTFFVVEVLSAAREGWLPRKLSIASGAPATVQAEEHGIKEPFFRRAAAVGLTIGLALLIVPPVWSLFPTGLVHERLCKKRSGEHLYQTASAKSYGLIGEGASNDGFHLHHAIEDVTTRRVEFIELVKDRRNFQQRNSLSSLLGTSDPPGEVFRISLGAAGSPDCARRLSPMYGTRFELEANQCVRFTPIAVPTSRYRVEAVTDEQATWYTPHILSYGVRVVDAERSVILGEHMRFARTGLLAFFTIGEKQLDCPGRYGFSPTKIHRKALLGEK
jgi:hypothetical protein